MNHSAAALKNHSIVNLEAWGNNVASKYSGLMNFYPVLGPDGSDNLSANDNGSRIDLALNPGPLTDNQGIGSTNFPAKDAANSDRPLKTELSLKLTAGVNDPGYRKVRCGCG